MLCGYSHLGADKKSGFQEVKVSPPEYLADTPVQLSQKQSAKDCFCRGVVRTAAGVDEP